MMSTLERDQHPRRWSADRNIRIFAAMEGPLTQTVTAMLGGPWSVSKPRR
jgi:hypothetical protein